MATVAYAWVIDGIDPIIVSDEGLDASWAAAAGFVLTHPGLVPPSSLPCGVDLRTGMLKDDMATITVMDVDRTLAGVFKASKANKDALTSTIEPGATVPAAVANKHVGLELFGDSGTSERRLRSCIPGFNIGSKHYGQNEAYANGIGSSWVTDDAITMESRRCAVYRVKYVNGAWQSLANAKRVWWGQLRGRGTYRRGAWTFSCFGAQSWISGTLGRGIFEDGIHVLPAFAITEDQAIMYAALDVVRLDDLGTVQHDYGDTSVFQDTSSLIGADSYADVVAAISTFLAVIVADTTNGQEFNKYGNDIEFVTLPGAEGITIDWRRGDTTALGDPYVDSGDSSRLTARLKLWAHEDVWRAAGYNPRLQNSDRDPVDNYEQYGQFQEVIGMDGYWQGAFYAASPAAMKAFEKLDFGDINASDCSNGGNPRTWPPLYPGGSAAFTGQPGQEFVLITNDPVLLAGSKSRPLLADPDDSISAYSLGAGVGDVTAQAILVLEGPYRRRGDEDQVDPEAGYAFEIERERREGRTVQVVRVNYRKNSDGTVATGSDGYPRFVTAQWYDPRIVGFDYKPIDGTWACFIDPPPDAEPITARPLTVFEARDEGDRISEVIQRILLTTGTGGSWYSDEALTTPLYGLGATPAYFAVGDNDTGGTVPKDAEEASMGLGVPASMVADPDDWLAVEEAAIGPDLARCKVAIYGVLPATVLFSRLLAPTGLAFSLSGGKYGVFDPWTLPTPEDSVLTLTPEDWGGDEGRPESATPQQNHRLFAAIDVLEVSARIEPIEKQYHVQLERAATDPGSPTRGAAQQKHRVLADFLIDPSLAITGNNWLTDLHVRWRQGFEFWGTDYSEVIAKVHMERGVDVWPGDGVLMTDSQLVGSDGAYGISTAAALVIGRDPNCAKEAMTLRLLVGPESEFVMYSPAAVVTQYVENEGGAGYKLVCEDDHFGDRSAEFDVDGFEEPAYSLEGGNATIELFQWNGVTLAGGIYGVVSSITSTEGGCEIVLTGALTGATFYRDRHTIAVLRTWADQAAWPQRWYAPITEDDGTHSSGTDGKTFMGV